MKVSALADLVLRERFGDLSDDNPLERIDAVESIYAALAWVMRKRYYENRSVDDEVSIDASLLSTYELDVEKDSDGVFYSTLTADPVDLPKGRGVYAVTPTMEGARPFHPMAQGEVFMFSGLPSTITTYSKSGRKIVYRNINPAVKKVKAVLVSARPEYIPSDLVKDVQDIVLGRWSKEQFKTDSINDGEVN